MNKKQVLLELIRVQNDMILLYVKASFMHITEEDKNKLSDLTQKKQILETVLERMK